MKIVNVIVVFLLTYVFVLIGAHLHSIIEVIEADVDMCISVKTHFGYMWAMCETKYDFPLLNFMFTVIIYVIHFITGITISLYRKVSPYKNGKTYR